VEKEEEAMLKKCLPNSSKLKWTYLPNNARILISSSALHLFQAKKLPFLSLKIT